MNELLVPHRFRGPARSGNGGWTAGALAAFAAQAASDGWPAVTVALRQPPPLDTGLPLTSEDGWTVASNDEGPVARARLAEAEPRPVEPVAAEQARAAEASYAGLTSHPFPSCFACGTGREPGDGLRIFPGRVADLDDAARLAATWTPSPGAAGAGDDDRADLPTTWAALDCVGGWSGDLAERMMVLGTMTARVHSLPRLGVEHVVVGHARGQQGRKTFTAASLYDADGALVATAEHVWIAVDPAAFN